MMAEAAPYSSGCRGRLTFYSRPHRTVELLAGTAYSPDIRAWPCLSRTFGCLPIRNADFGWAIARCSCGRDDVRAGKGGHDGYWHSEMVQPDERLWIHSTAGRRQGRIRPYLRG